jgi:hypothetical protein
MSHRVRLQRHQSLPTLPLAASRTTKSCAGTFETQSRRRGCWTRALYASCREQGVCYAHEASRHRWKNHSIATKAPTSKKRRQQETSSKALTTTSNPARSTQLLSVALAVQYLAVLPVVGRVPDGEKPQSATRIGSFPGARSGIRGIQTRREARKAHQTIFPPRQAASRGMGGRAVLRQA